VLRLSRVTSTVSPPPSSLFFTHYHPPAPRGSNAYYAHYARSTRCARYARYALFPCPHYVRLLTTPSPDLSHAVDVYSDWVDACDEIVDGKGGGPKSAESRRLSRAKPASRRDADGDDEPSGSGPRGGRAAPDDDSDGDLEDIDDDEQIAPRRSARDMDDDELEDDEDF
jgi:transcription elongation factor Elf1